MERALNPITITIARIPGAVQKARQAGRFPGAPRSHAPISFRFRIKLTAAPMEQTRMIP